MDGGYRLLRIRQEGDSLIACLPLSKMVGNDLSQALREDFQRLIQHASGSIVIDLRQVLFVDGSFFTQIMELWRGLKDRSIRLAFQLSPGLMEVARATKLDRLLELSDAGNTTQP